MAGTRRNDLFLVLLGLWLLAGVASAEGEQTSKKDSEHECKGPIRFYEDLGCTPVYADGNKHCPKRYDCSGFNQKDKCYAHGHPYEVDEKIKDEDRSDLCNVDCICRKENNEMKFVCGEVTCGQSKPLRSGCYQKHKLNTCCDMERVCPSRFKFRRVTCNYRGETYSEGHEFRPHGTNLLCQCEKGFNGKLVAPYCRNITCGHEIRNMAKIHQNCAPRYLPLETPNNTCNFDFQCPHGDEVVKHASPEHNDKDEENVCTFGKLKLHVGDRVTSDSGAYQCLKCECEMPPFVTCMRINGVDCDQLNLHNNPL